MRGRLAKPRIEGNDTVYDFEMRDIVVISQRKFKNRREVQ